MAHSGCTKCVGGPLKLDGSGAGRWKCDASGIGSKEGDAMAMAFPYDFIFPSVRQDVGAMTFSSQLMQV